MSDLPNLVEIMDALDSAAIALLATVPYCPKNLEVAVQLRAKKCSQLRQQLEAFAKHPQVRACHFPWRFDNAETSVMIKDSLGHIVFYGAVEPMSRGLSQTEIHAWVIEALAALLITKERKDEVKK